MSTDISPQNEQYIRHAIARGVFASRAQALDAAVELLKRREGIVREVSAGIDQIERSEVVPLDMEEMKAEIGKRLAEDASSPPSLSDAEFEDMADELADSVDEILGPDRQPLSDYAVSREGIYEDHL